MNSLFDWYCDFRQELYVIDFVIYCVCPIHAPLPGIVAASVFSTKPVGYE